MHEITRTSDKNIGRQSDFLTSMITVLLMRLYIRDNQLSVKATYTRLQLIIDAVCSLGQYKSLESVCLIVTC